MRGPLLMAIVAGGWSASAFAADLACESSTLGGDMFDARCVLAPTPQRYRYEVRFSGGHDDTRASLAPALDGVPIACEAPHSQLRLFAEEGDIGLACEFVAGSATGDAVPVFSVRVIWHHCQFEGARLEVQ